MPDKDGLTVFEDLPDIVVFREILARLPAKDVFRCRGVRKSWRSGTSTPRFMMDHHRRQPSLPVILQRKFDSSGAYVAFLGAGVGAVDRKLMPVVRDANPDGQVVLHAVRDGFLIISNRCKKGMLFFSICNPATRQFAPIPQLQRSSKIIIAGFYRHRSSGEYRVLYWDISEDVYYILKLGSGEQRCIGYPAVLSITFRRLLLQEAPLYFAPVLHRDNLHWFDNYDTCIMVFDTAVEKFRWMRGPGLEGPTGCLLEMDGMLAMCTTLEGQVIKVSVLRDYESEVWQTRYRIKLSPVATVHHNYSLYADLKMAIVNKRELLIRFPDNLLHFDIDGKFIGEVKMEATRFLMVTSQLLQESIFPLPCLQMQANGADQEPLFILGM